MRKIKSNIKHRVETGALQVNDDWAGLFIRGDDCITLRFILEDYLKFRVPASFGTEPWFAEKLLFEIDDVHGKVGES